MRMDSGSGPHWKKQKKATSAALLLIDRVVERGIRYDSGDVSLFSTIMRRVYIVFILLSKKKSSKILDTVMNVL
jgi:hypothetical protein